MAKQFELETIDGERMCEVGDVAGKQLIALVAPGDIALKILPKEEASSFRVGVAGGLATGASSKSDLKQAALDAAPNVRAVVIRDRDNELPILAPSLHSERDGKFTTSRWPLAGGRLEMVVGTKLPMITTGDRLILLLPFLMWLVASLLTWVVVTRLLIRPFRICSERCVRYEPGEREFDLPSKLGPGDRNSGSCATPSPGRSPGWKSPSAR